MPVDPANFGNRTDGTAKGMGFFGALKRPDGDISTELSIGVNIEGKELEIPLLVPGLTKAEIQLLLEDGEPTDEIVGKAVFHAQKRLAKGLSPFAGPDEQAGLPEDEE
jgi:hypothetical protein